MLPAGQLPMGEGAVLVQLDSLDQVVAMARSLRAGRSPWVLEVIPAARTVLVSFDPEAVGVEQVSAWISGAGISGRAPLPPAEDPPALRIPVRYDGPDLTEVADTVGLSVDEVVAAHLSACFTVAFCGFAPGFAYLSGLPETLRVPRRGSPRTAVPAGAVALADEFCAVYPRRSPGGWQLIGQTDLAELDAALFDPRHDPPVLLTPGRRVQFVRADG